MNVIYDKTKQHLPIKSWCPDLEEGAMKQTLNLANHPSIYKHVSVMSDGHKGYGMPIGGVIGCENAIIPNAVGVDIGCGMGFIQTNIPIQILLETTDTQDRTLVKCILDTVKRVVPVGFNKHKEPQDWSGFDSAPDIPLIQNNLQNAKLSLGTLGSGNHFIEIQKDTNDNLCFMLHSGSRNLGKQVCDHYNKIAVDINEKYKSIVPKEWELAFLPLDSDEGQEYLTAMNFALDFASQNRQVMMERFKSLAFNIIEKYHGHVSKAILMEVNAHHNYAAMENHFGKNVMIHRKGAIRARKGDMGIIPGSMETSSYIVEGLGNKDSFNSASHGAGRRMSRAKARKEFKVDDMVERLKKKGIILNAPNVAKTIDECGLAYKDIDEVIENEKDLVVVIEKVNQVGVIKG